MRSAVRFLAAAVGLVLLGLLAPVGSSAVVSAGPGVDVMGGAAAPGVVATARWPSWCRTGFAICVNKNTRTLYALRSGRLVKAMSARFGSSSYPTRNGSFTVQWKSRWHYSTRYHSAMPFSLFFSGGQAIHYSSNFARVGYDGRSHGCINLRSWSGAQWLFDNARVGTHVYVGRW